MVNFKPPSIFTQTELNDFTRLDDIFVRWLHLSRGTWRVMTISGDMVVIITIICTAFLSQIYEI